MPQFADDEDSVRFRSPAGIGHRAPMARALVLPLLALIVAGCAARATATRPFAPADRAAVQAVLDAQAAAWNRGDLAGYMAGYAQTDALVFTSGTKIRKGWRATFDAYQQRYARDPAAMGKLVFEVLAIDPVGADGAVVLGNWILTGSPSDGRGVFTVVLERRPEGWKVIHDHTSAAPPDHASAAPPDHAPAAAAGAPPGT